MPRPETTPEQKAEVRREIRKAAARIYNRDGQRGLSVRAIAREAGVSVGTIYTYFGSVQGLLESLWNGPVDRVADELKTLAETTADPVERIRKLLLAYVQFGKDNVEIYRNVFLFVRPSGKPSPIREPAEEAVFPALLIDAIRQGQAEGRIKEGDPYTLAMILWGSLHGCLALPHNFGRQVFENPDEIADTAVDTLMSAVIT